MKKSWIVMLVTLLTISFGTKAAAPDNDVREVGKFTEIALRISADVILVQGESHTVKIEASIRDIAAIETKVSGGTLTIKTDNWNHNFSKVTIYVTMQEVEGLKISGSGDITAKSAINTTDLELGVSGSGNIRLEKLMVGDLECRISGSGDIKLGGKGRNETCEIQISGSGNFSGYDIEFSDVEVRISGSGEAKVNASKQLQARVSGSGDVYYKGNPRIDAKISGSGKIKSN